MIEHIATELAEDGTPLREFYGSAYRGDCLPDLPWGDAPFDCILVCPQQPSLGVGTAFADEIVQHAVDWVQTTGVTAELLHDLVDEASVRVGRQALVGDGNPMTSWHEDARSLPEIAEVARHCLGHADIVLCLVLGDQDEREAISALLRQSLSGAD